MRGTCFGFANLEARSTAEKLDTRVKIICVVTALLLVSVSTHWQSPVMVFALCFVLAYYSKVPLKLYLRRMIYPISVIALVSVLQLFTYGSTIAITIPFSSVPIYLEGLQLGLLIFAKCVAAVAILNLLVCTSPMLEIISALKWLHVPSILLDLALLTLRYVFVIAEEAHRIYKAQESRCGYSKSLGLLKKLRNYGTLFGMLFVRSYDRALAIGRAMVSRGYGGRGELFALYSKPLPAKQVAYGLSLLSALVFLVVVDWLAL